MAKVARGKALVAKLRAQSGVRDAEALAAYLGRFKKARKAGKSVAAAQAAAKGGSASSEKKSGGALADRVRSGAPSNPAEDEARRKRLAEAADLIGDPFAEDYGPNEDETAEQKRQRKMEEALLRQMEKADRSKLYNAIMEQGGVQTRDDLREEYRAIPNNLKRKDGMAGDEMAEYLGTYYQELGIYSENDLLDYFAPDYRRAA